MLELEAERPLRRSAVSVVAGAAALLLLADVLRWMVTGPVPLLLLGRLLPPGVDLEAEAGLSALLAVIALVAAGGLRHRLGQATAVGGLTLTVLLANLGPFPTGDVYPAAMLPFAIVRNGQLTFEGTGLDQKRLPLSANPLPYFIVRSGERIASKYSPAVGVLATPIYLPAALGRFDANSPVVEHLGKLAAAILTALGVVLIFAAAARLAEPRLAAAATALYVLGTPVLPVVGQALWLHTGAVLGFSLALLGLTRSEDPPWRMGALVGSAWVWPSPAARWTSCSPPASSGRCGSRGGARWAGRCSSRRFRWRCSRSTSGGSSALRSPPATARRRSTAGAARSSAASPGSCSAPGGGCSCTPRSCSSRSWR
jgi:hypothetical protein